MNEDALTHVINHARDEESINELIELVYPNLRRLAAHHSRSGRASSQEDGITSLVNEAYPHLRRALENLKRDFINRKQFFALVSRILSRLRIRLDRRAVLSEFLDENITAETASPLMRLEVEQILERMRKKHGDRVEAFELRFQCGWTTEEVAKQLDRPKPTVKSWINYVRAELAKQLREKAELPIELDES